MKRDPEEIYRETLWIMKSKSHIDIIIKEKGKMKEKKLYIEKDYF